MYGWTSKICPLLPPAKGKGVLWEDAQIAWKTYAEKAGGSDQPLERLAERGGFGVEEFVYFFHGIGAIEAHQFGWKVDPCVECRGVGEIVSSEDGGLIMKCGVCMGAGAVLPVAVREAIGKVK